MRLYRRMAPTWLMPVDTMESMDTETAEEPVEQQTETGEQVFIESVEVVAEEAANSAKKP